MVELQEGGNGQDGLLEITVCRGIRSKKSLFELKLRKQLTLEVFSLDLIIEVFS